MGDSSTDEWNWTRGALVFYYGTAARDAWNAFATTNTDNNGNVLRQVNYVPLSGGGNVIPQLDDYTYDALNRIASMTEAQQASSGTWTYGVTSQTYTYDRWGNRTSVTGQTAQSWSTTEAAATNRLKLASGNTCTGTKVGLCYDAAGNLIFDNQLGSGGDRTYDAEGRILTAAGGGTNKYVYDADGKRVRRQVGSAQYWQVYGIGGELLAEYQWNGTTATLQKEYGYAGEVSVVAESATTVRWLVKDHLGTARMIADQSGSLAGITRHDYYPFGEEDFAGATIRTTTNGYQAEGVRQKFTGYERDTETNLDYAQARYYANLQGRFVSPDKVFVGQDESDPQTWNLYSYTSNNPLNRVDTDGQRWFYKQNSDGQIYVQWVDPNDDGTYTSPGKGWVELTPDKTLTLYINNGREAFVIGERENGTPFVTRPLATGKTEINLMTVAEDIAVVASGRIVITGAGALWDAYLVKLAERQIANRISSEIAKASVNPKIYAQLEKQLARDGAKTIFKALRNAEKAIEEHISKIDTLKYKSQVEGTIRNVANQIKTLQKFIKDKGL